MRAALLGLCVAALRPALAQQPRPFTEPPQFAVDQWTTEHGLPQNSVNALAQTPDGYLWVGTFGGLARFDGSTFRLMERSDSTGRHIDRVLSLAVAQDGGLWVGTESGLLRLHAGRWDSYSAADGLPDNEITTIHVDRAGTLWIGTERGGLARFHEGRFEAIRQADGVPLAHVVGIQEDAHGVLWVNVGDRFITVEKGVPSARRWQGRLVRDAIHMALEDRAGGLWFNRAEGLARVHNGIVQRYGRGDGVPGRPSMIEDPMGGFWLGTANDGLFFLAPDGREPARPYPLPDGRRRYRVRSAHVDREGDVWFGTDANGLLRVKRNLFTTYTSASGVSHDVATAVYVDAAGTVWAGTNCGGVNAIDLATRSVRTWKPRKPGDPTGDPCVFALTEPRPGVMLAGTWGGGLTEIRDGRERRLRVPGLRDSVVLALFTDRDGIVWVGTNAGGLAALEDGRLRAAYTTADGLAHNSVRTISQTRDGAVWIGTLGGLSRLAHGRITSYTAADGLSAPHVRAIHEDEDGNLWIGTYGGGINRFRDGAFRAVSQRDGLADDVVSAIVEDEGGQLWLSGNRGISRVSRAQLVAFTDGRIRRVHSVLYREADGLQNAETNGGFHPAVAKDARGFLWFPTVRGFAVVDPARVVVVGPPPAVALEEIVINGVSRALAGDRIVVGPGRPNLEFRYAGLSLTAPQHVAFRYRLLGFDDAWVDAGSRRVAYYPRLPPGEYRFAVMAANRDGAWNEAGATVALVVRGPLWSTWWFRIAAAVVGLALVFVLADRRVRLAHRRRLAEQEFSRRLIESQERERKRVAGELHDGLGQELLVIKNRALLALRADGVAAPVREQLEHISDVVGQSLDAVRGLAHNLTPYQLDHLGLSAALRTMIETAADAVDIRFEITVDDVDGLLPVEGQINLYRIVQEAVSNIVRHSGALTAAVRVWRSDDVIAVVIRDDGRGFPVSQDGAGRLAGGFGLSGIGERARILRGRLEVTSAPGQGARLDLAVPIAGAARAASERPG